jgi:anti-sigma regulatory factor (Ser/Thr protein kinase)
MALVELRLPPLAVHVRTARLVVVAAARRAGIEDGLVDELRFAVGEACSRAMGLHARYAPDSPVRILVDDSPAGLVVSVIDEGPAAGPVPDDPSAGLLEDASEEDADGDLDLVDPDLALALLTGLVDTATVDAGPDGTTVTMRWPLPVPARGPGATAISTS